MNAIDALYAVTRMNWYQCRQDADTLALFKQCKGFRFPLLHCFKQDPQLWHIDLPWPYIQPLPEALLVYIFGPSVVCWEEGVSEQWKHNIRASLSALQGRQDCECCQHTLVMFQNQSSKRRKLYK